MTFANALPARSLRPGLAWMSGGDLLGLGSRALTLVALVAIAVGFSGASLRLDGYGLVGSVQPAFYIGLALLPAASALEWARGRRCSGALIVLHVVLFVLVIWSMPLLLEGTPRFRTSYSNFGDVDPLVRGDGLMPDTFVYHNWPLFPLLMAGIVKVGVPPLLLMGWFPVVLSLAYLVPLAAMLWIVGGVAGSRQSPATAAGTSAEGARVDGRWLLPLWIFPVFDWTGQDYFSPQAFAYLLFLGWVTLLLYVAVRRDGQFSARLLAATIGLFTLIVATHVLTSLFALAVLAALSVARSIRQRSLIFTSLLIFLAWQAYIAAPFFTFYRAQLVQTLLDAPNFIQTNLGGRLQGSPEHSDIARIRTVVTGVIFIVGAIAGTLLVRRRPLRRATAFALSYLVGLAIVAPVSVYGGEMLIRVLLFSLPMLMLLVAQVVRSRGMGVLLAAALISMAPVHVLTHYGNELYDYISPSELAGYEYVADNLAPANIFGAFPAGRFLNTANLDSRNATVPRGEQIPRVNDYRFPAAHRWRNEDWPVYVAISRGDRAAMSLFYNEPTFLGDVSSVIGVDPRFRRVFANPDITIYRWSGSTQAAAGPSAPSASATLGTP